MVSGNNFLEKASLLMGQILFLIPIVLILFSPFIYSYHLAQGPILGKFLWIFFCTIAIIPFLLYSLFLERISIKNTDLLVIVLLFYFIIQGLLLNGVDYLQNSKLIYLSCSSLVYFSLKRSLTIVNETWRKGILLLLLTGIFLSTILVSSFGILQKLGFLKSFNGTFLVTSTFFHPAPFAGFLSIVFPLSISCFLVLNKLNSMSRLILFVQWLSFITAGIIIVIIPSLASRAAFLGLIVSSAFIILKSNQRLATMLRSLTKRKLINVLLALVFLFLGFFILYKIREESVKGRWLVWRISLEMIKREPIFGKGLDSFKKEYPIYQTTYFKSGEAIEQEVQLSCEVSSSFNEVIQIISEVGLIGFCIFFLIVYYTYVKISFYCSNNNHEEVRIYDSIRTGSQGSIISFIIFSTFSYPFSLPDLTLFFFIFLFFANLNFVYTTNNLFKTLIYKSGVLIISLVILSYSFIAYNTLTSSYKWHQANLLALENGNILDANILYRKIFKHLKNNDKYLYHFALNLAKQNKYDSSNYILNYQKVKSYDDLMLQAGNYMKLNNYIMSEKYFWKGYFLLPHRFLPLYFLMRTHLISNNNKEAKKIAQQIINKKAKVQTSEVAIIKREARLVLEDYSK